MFFSGFLILFTLMLLLILGMFLFIVIRSVSQRNANNGSPRLTVIAIVVSKRMDVSYRSTISAKLIMLEMEEGPLEKSNTPQSVETENNSNVDFAGIQRFLEMLEKKKGN